MLKVAIIGRPNVGKSTLFNKLLHKSWAIVADMPGVTRDCMEEKARLFDLDFLLYDTPGIDYDGEKEQKIIRDMMKHTSDAIEEADVILFMVDGKFGLHSYDEDIAKNIKISGRDAILVINKCDYKRRADSTDFFKLGFENVVCISAEHSEGFHDIYSVLMNSDDFKNYKERVGNDEHEYGNQNGVRVTILGRPNCGKSTLVNKFLGHDRVLTGENPGVTRDAIFVEMEYKEKKMILCDTAGVRKKTNIIDRIEKMSVDSTMASVRYANVVVLMLSADQPLERQDLYLVKNVIKEGRAVVVVINKWDTIENKKEYWDFFKHYLKDKLESISGVKVITISALYDKNCNSVLDSIISSYNVWSSRIKTSVLNEWLPSALNKHQTSLSHLGRKIKIKFISQINTRPPTFLLSVNLPQDLEKSYVKYLTNSIRSKFNLYGVPIRMLLRKSNNPYHKVR